MKHTMKTNASGFLKISTSRAIYPGSRKGCYVGLLLFSKLLRTVALFIAYDILQFTNVVQFLFIVKLFASLFLLVIQKPFSRGKRLSKHQWVRVIQHGFSNAVVSVLWLLGLAHAGPLRAILLFEHHHLVVAAAVGALLSGIGGASKMRGAVFIIVAVVTLLLFDSDGSNPISDSSAVVSQDSSQIVQYIISWTGVTDHKGGVLLLVIALCLHKGCEAMGRRLSVEIGGAKRLNAMATLASALTMAPWAFFTRFTQQDAQQSNWMELVIPLASIAVILFVIDYYVESVCFMKLEATSAIRNSWIPMFIFAAILTLYWKSSYIIAEATYTSHQLSGGVIFSCVAILIATYLLSSPSRQASKGTLIGYSESGEPLYSSHGDTMQNSSCLNTIKHSMKSIFEDSDSRRIFYFLCLNLTYTFVELVYGIWTNSLGLIADGFHMLFDCSALVMGICAALMSKWKATPTFSFGYSRVDALSGFVNGLFLVVISFFVCSTALSRLWDPPQIISEKLLTVSVAGLCVNIVGILTFLRPKSSPQTRDAHSRHGHGHPHSHSHGGGHHGHSHNANMEGVFLHVLADTLGSLGVIVSSVLIENFGWLVADPICSLFISVLIFLSVLPLLWHSMQVLLLRVPVVIEKKLAAAVFKVVRLEGVVSYRNLHVWQHSSEIFAGTIHVHVTKESLEQRVVSQVTAIFRELGVNIFTVQVEKDDFFHHLSGLSSAVNSSRLSLL